MVNLDLVYKLFMQKFVAEIFLSDRMKISDTQVPLLICAFEVPLSAALSFAPQVMLWHFAVRLVRATY